MDSQSPARSNPSKDRSSLLISRNSDKYLNVPLADTLMNASVGVHLDGNGSGDQVEKKMNKRKRIKKTIPRQYELIVEELETNAVFSNDALDVTWKNLAAKLNACGGPQRPLDVWKRIFVDWKSHTKGKDKLLKVENGKAGAPNNKLSDLEVRLLRVIRDRDDLVSSTVSVPQHDPVVIENSDRIEFVDEEGAIISNIDKLEFICDEPQPNKIRTKETKKPRQTKKEHEHHPPCNGFDEFLEAMPQSNKRGLSVQVELLTELRGIKTALENQLKALHVQNGINRLQAQILYEKAKAKYQNFNLKIRF